MNTKIKAIGLFAIALLVLTASVGSAQASPDLTVSSISVNPGDTRADEIVRFYVNDNNEISADVCNIGDTTAGKFDVCFAADGAKIGCVGVKNLAPAACKTVGIDDWTPTCKKYPVMPGFPAQALPITITVTADCSCKKCPTCPPDGSNGKMKESDETNNALSMDIPTIQSWTYKPGYVYDVIGGVVNNGYRSKNFDCDTSEEPLTLFEYDRKIVGGGIAYNVSGDKQTLSTRPFTRVHHIDIPVGATVKEARLYVYWYDYWTNYKTYPTGCLADLSVDFEGMTVPPAAMYNDQKGFGAYHSPKGTYAYDVTSLVSGSGDYTAVITNNGVNKTTLLGELLYVVYEGDPDGKTIQLWTLEGNDYLMAADETHNKYDYGVSPKEATATVAFPGKLPKRITSATLVTVVTQGMAPGTNMLFNGNVIKAGAWDAGSEAGPKSVPSIYYYGSRINVESVDVTANLAKKNTMGFEDTGTNGMQASNAFLIVECA
jgi:hypothetical protein